MELAISGFIKEIDLIFDSSTADRIAISLNPEIAISGFKEIELRKSGFAGAGLGLTCNRNSDQPRMVIGNQQ